MSNTHSKLAPLTQTDTGERGNTKLSPTEKQSTIKGRRWCFTLNNYTADEVTHLTQTFESKKIKYIFGKEKGETRKTPHLQGYFESKNAIRFTTIKKWNPRFHLEKAKGTIVDNCIYCAKEGIYTTNISEFVWRDRTELILDDEYKDVVWKPFQQKLLDELSTTPNKRSVIWCCETKGNIGKSYLCKYIALTMSGVILANGKANDINNQINTMMSSEEPEEPKIIILDIPRHNLDYINYGCIESIKNGFIYSGKYEGGKCLFRIPHVLIFANDTPDYSKWSEDRYDVRELDSGTASQVSLTSEPLIGADEVPAA